MFEGDGDDFMNVALREGGVLVHINLGSGLFETDIKPHRGSVRFDDNQWHRLVITREAREVSHIVPFIGMLYQAKGNNTSIP